MSNETEAVASESVTASENATVVQEELPPGTPVEETAELEESATTAAETLERGGLNLPGLIEALLFASGEPLSGDKLCEVARCEESELQAVLGTLTERYRTSDSGYELVQVAGKYQLRTKAQFADFIRELRASRPRRLSNAALETLAIIAYRQPIVKSDVEKIRGVDVTPTLKTLLERSLVKILGHQNSVGQPSLFGTTEEFLKLFGLDSLRQLPTLRDIRDLERDPGETSGEEAAA